MNIKLLVPKMVSRYMSISILFLIVIALFPISSSADEIFKIPDISKEEKIDPPKIIIRVERYLSPNFGSKSEDEEIDVRSYSEDGFEYEVVNVEEYTLYASTNINARSIPSVEGEKVDSIKTGEELKIVGESETNDTSYTSWVEVENEEGEKFYVFKDLLCEDKPQEKKITENNNNSQKTSNETVYQVPTDDKVLNTSNGHVEGPSGRETYYNLDMNKIVDRMQKYNVGDYWVREDGVKMLGPYVMVAANLNTRPRGTVVETSLGLGIVCDTGDFAKKNPMALDIATDW